MKLFTDEEFLNAVMSGAFKPMTSDHPANAVLGPQRGRKYVGKVDRWELIAVVERTNPWGSRNQVRMTVFVNQPPYSKAIRTYS